MEELKYRHELKHTMNYFDYVAIKSRLAAIMKTDANVGGDGTYKIRSLYFDNLDDKALREKIDGVNNREKFRIRYYNDSFDCIKLEKKSKRNGLCLKQSTLITEQECRWLLDGHIKWMADSKRALLMELYAKMQFQQLRPRVIVDYTREPYIYAPGNVRVTIDSDIRTGLYHTNLFNHELPTIQTDKDVPILLEVKFDDFLPEVISNIIQLKDRRSAAFSKYAVSRMYG